jgi:crotonobetainyl-CoA:carnitine CoA-transferase CaiB-like acyl-CoA transferase
MGVLPTADGFINIGVAGDGQWQSFCTVIDREDLVAAAQFATMAQRFDHRPELRSVLEPIFRSRPSAYWIEVLNAGGVPAGPIYKMNEMFADPQVRHLGIAVPLTHPERGDIRVVGQPVTLSRTPAAVVTAIPEKGAHNDEVLAEFGFSATDIARLRAEKGL